MTESPLPRTPVSGLPRPGVAPGPDLFRFDGQVVLVTGAGGAFGRATALAFARSGARVFVTDIAEAALSETESTIRAEGFACSSEIGDVSKAADIDRVFHKLDATYGRIDVLVNNAGINPHQGGPEVFPMDVWDLVIATNLTAYLRFAQGAARRMIAAGTGGSIVNVSSIAGSSALGRGNLAFGVSKAGVEQMTRELGVAWAYHGIWVNAIQPCQFASAGFVALAEDARGKALVDRMLSGIPAGRMGEAEEVAGPILFLASAAASMVTGVVLPVDGGNLALNPGGSIGSDEPPAQA